MQMIQKDTCWSTLHKPIIGLAPMDGITDPAFRAVVDEIAHPAIYYTEFVSADGLCRNPKRLLRTFQSHETKTPLIGQLVGAHEDAMEEAAYLLISNTTVSGIDINMGCPSGGVASQGGGAALINKPKVAQKLIYSVQKAIKKSKKNIALSVKTRIGINEIVTNEWIPILLETGLDAIALHGRTLKQQYTDKANWTEIQKAAVLAKSTSTLLLGNGDVSSLLDAKQKAQNYSPDGVLIGRSSLGNPWVFTEHTPTEHERIFAALRHCSLFLELIPEANPISLRKHIAWYIKGLLHATTIREHIMTLSTVKEMQSYLTSLHI